MLKRDETAQRLERIALDPHHFLTTPNIQFPLYHALTIYGILSPPNQIIFFKSALLKK
jgi:hypothetical protein